MADISNSLPPGWDCKYDPRTARYYYINHYTKQTTWEDPRLRYRQIHGTPSHVPVVEHIPLQDLSNLRSMGRASNGSAPGNKPKETTLTQPPTDTEAAVGKISTMFPTVAETHIRLLMKKYMKSIFPQVEETILLEVLGNNENNVQKASEALKEMGFEKKEMKLNKKSGSSKRDSKKQEDTSTVIASPKILTQEEKNTLKKKFQDKYCSIPERVIILALESAEYHSSRTQQILDIVVQEDSVLEAREIASSSAVIVPKDCAPEQQSNKKEESNPGDLLKKSKSSLITPSPSIHAFQSDKLDIKVRRTKEKKSSVREALQENVAPESTAYRSAYLLPSLGPNNTLAKGSDNSMLLEDYVSWDGPDPRLRNGSAGVAQGPNKGLLSGRAGLAQGPNPALRKGPARLAQGSLYTKIQSVSISESRGK